MRWFASIFETPRAAWRMLDRRSIARSPEAYVTYLWPTLLACAAVMVFSLAFLGSLPLDPRGGRQPHATIVVVGYLGAALGLLGYAFASVRRISTFVEGPLSTGRTAAYSVIAGTAITLTPALAHQILLRQLDGSVQASGGVLCRDVAALSAVRRECHSLYGSSYGNPPLLDEPEMSTFLRCWHEPARAPFGARLDALLEVCRRHRLCSDDAKLSPEMRGLEVADQRSCDLFEDELVIKDPRYNWSPGPWNHEYGKELAVHLGALQIFTAGGPFGLRVLEYVLWSAVILLSAVIVAVLSAAGGVWVRAGFVVIAAFGAATAYNLVVGGVYPFVTWRPVVFAAGFVGVYALLVATMLGAYRIARLRRAAEFSGALVLLASPLAAPLVAWLVLRWRGHHSAKDLVGIFSSIGEYVTFWAPNWQPSTLYAPGTGLHWLNLYFPRFLGLGAVLLHSLMLAVYAPLVTRSRLRPRRA